MNQRLNDGYLDLLLDAARGDFREIEEMARVGRESLENVDEDEFSIESAAAAYNALDKIQVLAAKVLKGI